MAAGFWAGYLQQIGLGCYS